MSEFKRIKPGVYSRYLYGHVIIISKKAPFQWSGAIIKLDDSGRPDKPVYAADDYKSLKEAKLVLNNEANMVMVEKTNLLTGEKFMESITTPHSCSPSSETYWSM